MSQPWIVERHLKTSDQNVCTLGQDQKRWPRVPTVTLHFGQIGEVREVRLQYSCTKLHSFYATIDHFILNELGKGNTSTGEGVGQCFFPSLCQ